MQVIPCKSIRYIFGVDIATCFLEKNLTLEKKMEKIVCLFVCLFVGSANAGVILDDFEITDSSLSFHATGTISSLGTSFHQQLSFGLVDDDTSDWITSFDAGSSTWVEGLTNSVSTSNVYDLTGIYSDSLLTVGSSNWQIGDQIDIAFNFVGVFNTSNFDINNFGMQAGYRSGSIVSSTYDLVEGINPATSVPEPASIALLGLGLAGIGFSRKKKIA